MTDYQKDVFKLFVEAIIVSLFALTVLYFVLEPLIGVKFHLGGALVGMVAYQAFSIWRQWPKTKDYNSEWIETVRNGQASIAVKVTSKRQTKEQKEKNDLLRSPLDD